MLNSTSRWLNKAAAESLGAAVAAAEAVEFQADLRASPGTPTSANTQR